VEPPAALLPELLAFASTVPVTSTRLPAFDANCDCADSPSRMYVLPLPAPADVAPVVPAVDPAVALVGLELDELPIPEGLAFVRMNDAPLPLPDVERDVLVPAADPVVPTAPLESPGCRQPITVMVSPLLERFASLCGDPGAVCPPP
jgi:hypothetical protein